MPRFSFLTIPSSISSFMAAVGNGVLDSHEIPVGSHPNRFAALFDQCREQVVRHGLGVDRFIRRDESDVEQTVGVVLADRDSCRLPCGRRQVPRAVLVDDELETAAFVSCPAPALDE